MSQNRTIGEIKKNRFSIIIGISLLLSLFLPGLGYLFTIFFVSQLFTKTFQKINFILCFFFSVLFVGAMLAILTFFIDAITPYGNEFIIVSILFSLFNVAYLLLTRGQLVKYNLDNIGVSLTALLVSIAAIVFLLFPLLQIKNASQMIYFLSTAEDNASHFALFDHDLTVKSVTYFDQKPTGVITSLTTYPQGTHVFAAFSFWSFVGDGHHSTFTLLRMYYLSLVLACASLLFILAEIIGRLIKNRFRYLAIIVGSIVLFTGSIIYLAGWGFITQIIALVYLLTLIYILALVKPNKDIKRHFFIFELVVYGMLSVGVAFSWYLLLFIAFVVLINKLRLAFKNRFIRYSTVLPLVIFIISPLILNISRSRAASSLNQPGGVYIYGIYAMILIMISIVIFGVLLVKVYKRKISINIPILLFISSAYAMSILIAVYQLFDGGSLQYYFYKSVYLLFMVAVIAILVFLANGLNRVRKIQTTTTLYAVLALCFVGSYALVNPTYPRVYVNNWFYHYFNPDTLSQAVALRDSEKSTTTDVIYQDSCSYIGEYLSNRWTGAIFLSESTDRSAFTNDALSHKTGIKTDSTYIKSHPNAKVISLPCN